MYEKEEGGWNASSGWGAVRNQDAHVEALLDSDAITLFDSEGEQLFARRL